jgi:hypothetical protein
VSSDTMPEGHDTPAPPRPDFVAPIARAGEQQFACILRNRSGFDAGNIDFGARDVRSLCESEQQDVVSMAYSLYLLYREQTGKDDPRALAADRRAEDRGGVVAAYNAGVDNAAALVRYCEQAWYGQGETRDELLEEIEALKKPTPTGATPR